MSGYHSEGHGAQLVLNTCLQISGTAVITICPVTRIVTNTMDVNNRKCGGSNWWCQACTFRIEPWVLFSSNDQRILPSQLNCVTNNYRDHKPNFSLFLLSESWVPAVTKIKSVQIIRCSGKCNKLCYRRYSMPFPSLFHVPLTWLRLLGPLVGSQNSSIKVCDWLISTPMWLVNL